ncbi:MAG: hypothetical protein WCF20_09095 [Methylovirgula sp.]
MSKIIALILCIGLTLSAERVQAQCYQAFTKEDLPVHPAPYAKSTTDTLAAGSEICVLQGNGSYAHIQYRRGEQELEGWVGCYDMSVTGYPGFALDNCSLDMPYIPPSR